MFFGIANRTSGQTTTSSGVYCESCCSNPLLSITGLKLAHTFSLKTFSVHTAGVADGGHGRQYSVNLFIVMHDFTLHRRLLWVRFCRSNRNTISLPRGPSCRKRNKNHRRIDMPILQLACKLCAVGSDVIELLTWHGSPRRPKRVESLMMPWCSRKASNMS